MATQTFVDFTTPAVDAAWLNDADRLLYDILNNPADGAAVLTGLGITSTVAELNVLDGITPTVTELNYVDGVTSAIQTQMDLKAPSASPTITGTGLVTGTLTPNGAGTITATTATTATNQSGGTVAATTITASSTIIGSASVKGATATGTTTSSAIVGAASSSGTGVYGISSTSGHGVQGTSSSGYGVYGISTSGTAVYGTSSSSYGVVAAGDATSPTTAAFRIVPQDTQPTTGAQGDIYVTTAGVLKICTVAGTPGTWASVGTQT